MARVKIKCGDNGKIYAGTVIKNGQWGSHCDDVTDDAIRAVFQYIVDMRTNGDNTQTIEFKEPVHKWGKKKYSVQITVTPE